MKKTAKKLVLAKETARILGAANLLEAAGGTPSVPPIKCDEGYLTEVDC